MTFNSSLPQNSPQNNPLIDDLDVAALLAVQAAREAAYDAQQAANLREMLAAARAVGGVVVPQTANMGDLEYLAAAGGRFCRVSAWNSTEASPGKNPNVNGDDCMNKPRTLAEVVPHTRAGGNVGMITGFYSANICMLDVDVNYSGMIAAIPALAGVPTVVRDGADKGKILIRIVGALPKSKSWKAPKGQKGNILEWLATGRQGVVYGRHPEGMYYRLINTDRSILELTPEELNNICWRWAGSGVLNDGEPPAPSTGARVLSPDARPEHKNGDGLYEAVKAYYDPLKVFQLFGRASNTRLEKHDTELRLLGNGGLFIHVEGGAYTYWNSVTEPGVGGGIFESWQYCKNGDCTVPTGAGFSDLLKEMAQAAGIQPATPAVPEVPEFADDWDTGAPPEDIDTNVQPAPGQPAQARPAAQGAHTAPPDIISARYSTYADMEGAIGPVEFSWSVWLPKGMLTIIASESGTGKSLVMMRICGCFLSGLPWPDGTPFTGEKGSVLWCEAEAAQAINLERAKAWGYPLDKIILPFEDPLEDVNLDNAAHQAAITMRAQLPEVRVIVVDSLSGSTSKKENDTEIKKITEFLARMARDTGKPVMLSHHLNKAIFGNTEVTMDRLRGSTAIVQHARVIWALDCPNPNAPENKRLKMIKNNLRKFAGPIGVTATDNGLVFGVAPSAPRELSQLEQAQALLKELLADGPVKSKTIESAADAKGISWRTVNQAKKNMGIIDRREGGGKGSSLSWQFPDDDEPL